MDSGNTHANLQGRYGQFSYDWFENPITSYVKGSPFETNDQVSIIVNQKIQADISDFLGSVGFAHFARHDQYGNPVAEAEIVFPFELEYRPTGEIHFPKYTYEKTIFEQMKEIPVGTILY